MPGAPGGVKATFVKLVGRANVAVYPVDAMRQRSLIPVLTLAAASLAAWCPPAAACPSCAADERTAPAALAVVLGFVAFTVVLVAVVALAARRALPRDDGRYPAPRA